MIALLLIGLAAASDAAPHFSYPSLVTANGYGAIVYSTDRLADGYPHLYQEYTPGDVTPDLLYDAYWGWVGGRLGGFWNASTTGHYVAHGGIVQVDREANTLGIALHEYAFAPMTAPGFALAQVVQVENTGTTTASAFQLVSMVNWHVGGTETVTSADPSHVTEAGSDVTLWYEAPGANAHACSGVYDSVNSGISIGSDCNYAGDDVVPGFGWDVPSLAPGETAWYGVYTTSVSGDGWVAGRGPEQWLTDEIAWWDAFHASATAPAMSEAEAGVYAQQLAFLKMAQVKEPGDAYGQIPASLPLAAPVGGSTHIWNITWVRDATWAAAGLLASGHPDEAADALRFLIQEGKTGDYRAYVGGGDYAVSVCRTYGDGTEWSDSDANGPNVEFDDFGLYLWVLARFHDAGRDDVVAELGPRALDGVADVLMGLVDPNTGLLVPDSSIWERHWNGHQEQFTWSSVWAASGLRGAATIAAVLGDGRADGYSSAAASMQSAIETHLVDAAGVVPASLQQLQTGSDYLDLAAVEAFNQGVLDPTGPSFAASMEAWDDHLSVQSGHGYMRNDDGDTYDSHEWIFVDLRVVEALRRAGRLDDAQALEDWVTAQAGLNADTLPELYDPVAANYAGPAPMLGFGAGVYVYDMATRGALLGGDDTADSGGPTTIVNEDCGCSTSPVAGPLPLLRLFGVLTVAGTVYVLGQRKA